MLRPHGTEFYVRQTGAGDNAGPSSSSARKKLIPFVLIPAKNTDWPSTQTDISGDESDGISSDAENEIAGSSDGRNNSPENGRAASAGERSSRESETDIRDLRASQRKSISLDIQPVSASSPISHHSTYDDPFVSTIDSPTLMSLNARDTLSPLHDFLFDLPRSDPLQPDLSSPSLSDLIQPSPPNLPAIAERNGPPSRTEQPRSGAASTSAMNLDGNTFDQHDESTSSDSDSDCVGTSQAGLGKRRRHFSESTETSKRARMDVSVAKVTGVSTIAGTSDDGANVSMSNSSFPERRYIGFGAYHDNCNVLVCLTHQFVYIQMSFGLPSDTKSWRLA